jgi:hypothetical protein
MKMSDYMTVFKCTPQKHTRTDWRDYWDLVYGIDDQMLFISKELYNYNAPEENRVFDFNLVLELQILELDSSDDEDNCELISNLYLVPTIQNIHNSIKEEIMKEYQNIDNEDEILLTDLLWQTQFPILHSECPHLDFETFDENSEEISKYLLSASIVAECTERLRAMYLDKIMNRIGTTNWDLLDGVLHGIDPFKQSLERISEQMKEGEE